ncbi:MAG TPA: hypothetical protein VLA23_07895 [Candidatus Limnocylindrales bacterium]|nr:hypothetical protein [Candidatus Limnocylindrales bacterium]
MTEIQPLEDRLAAAVRSIADRAATEVDAVAVAERAIQDRPAVGESWLRRTVPVPIGLLFLLGLLILGLLGAVLVSGSWSSDRVSGLATCPAGSRPDEPGPADQARPQGGSGAVVDRQSGLLVMLAAGERRDGQPETQIWHFDLCTNAWRKSAAVLPAELPHDGYGATSVYDAESDLIVNFGTRRIVVYDADSASARIAARPTQGDRTRAAYDPVSDLIFVLDAGQLWTYDVDLDAWQEVPQTGDLPPASNEGVLMAYDASVQRIVLYHVQRGYGQTYEFDPTTSAWTHLILGSRRAAPEMGFFYGDVVAGGEIAYDEANARTIVFTRGRAIAYDATAHSWQVVFDAPMEADPPVGPGDLSQRGAADLAYDPLNHRSLAIGGLRYVGADSIEPDDVIAFDLGTRTWMELLAPSAD